MGTAQYAMWKEGGHIFVGMYSEKCEGMPGLEIHPDRDVIIGMANELKADDPYDRFYPGGVTILPSAAHEPTAREQLSASMPLGFEETVAQYPEKGTFISANDEWLAYQPHREDAREAFVIEDVSRLGVDVPKMMTSGAVYLFDENRDRSLTVSEIRLEKSAECGRSVAADRATREMPTARSR